MNALLAKIVEQLNSSVFVLLLMLVFAAIAIFRLGRWMEKFSQHDRRLDKVEAIHDKVVELTTKINLIYTNTNPRAVVAAHSPLGLTEFGEKLAESIDAKGLYDKYAAPILEVLEARCPMGANAYDIQTVAMELAQKDFPNRIDAQETLRLKQAAFDRGMLFEDIWAIFGVYLRDEILNRRGISVLEVDRHDPTRKDA